MNLETAISLAASAHVGQEDKGGNPYILHPLRVMLKASDDDTRIVAVLHDVVEDSNFTLNDLSQIFHFKREILEAVDALTKRKGETYDEFIQRVKQNELARRVKILDLEDNMMISRIPNPTENDYARIEKYMKALEDLLS